MLIARKPGLKYVHRTAVEGYDYDETTLSQDGAWHTISLAAIIPASAKLVLLRVGAAHASPGQYFRVAKAGESNLYSFVNVATQVAYIINEQTALVDCTGQQIKYWASFGMWDILSLVVLGWFL